MNTENVSPATSRSDDSAPASALASSGHLWMRNFQQVRVWLVAHTFETLWLPFTLRPWFIGYLMAVVLQVFAVFLTELIVHVYPLFSFSEAPVLLVVVVLSLLWGSGPGILATLTGTFLLVLLVISPYFAMEFKQLEDGIGIALYLVIGLMIGLMANRIQRVKASPQKGVEATRQQLYDLFNQIPMPISVLRGPDLRFEFINPLTQQAMGKREVLGKPIREALPEYAAQGILDLVNQVYTTGKPLIVRELRAETMHYKDGPPVPIERYFNVVYQPLSVEQGVVDGVMIFNIDVTEQVLASKQKERLVLEREQERDHLREVLIREQELRKIAEDATRQLRTVLEVLPVSVTIADASGHVSQRNATMLQIWGEQAPEASSIADYQHYQGTWTETGEPLAADDWPLAQAIAKGEVSYGKEIDILSFNGQQKTLLHFAAPIRDEHGVITGGVIAGLDITSRKQLERALRQAEQQTRESLQALLVLAESLVSVPMTGEGNREVTVSALEDVAQRLVSLIRSVLNCKRVSITILDPRTQELRSLAVVGLPAEQEKQWHERRPGFYLSDRVMDTSLEAQFSLGNVVVVNMQEAPFAGQANPYGIKVMLLAPMRIGTRLIGILALDHGGEEWVVTDGEKMLAKAVAELAALILERERLLEERAENQANVLALQEANYLKDEFIGIAGHELRTPLTTVKASVQLARRQVVRLLKLEGALSPEAEKLIAAMQILLDRAERQIGMQNRLVNDLLDVSRIETGRLELHPELGDLAALIHEVVEDQQALTPERRILFEQSISGEVLVLVDADRLRQVMTNYLSNALKYSAADQPVIVRIVLLETEVRVEVEDRGPGLTDAQQQRIWERFYRVPGIEVRSGSGVGLGLGLHISRMIIERHGGYVGVRSVKGQGSTFWIVLPRAE
ncbi:MAG TPA: ATP-binding protein [Ktedonobacteraceae bacterium]